MKTRQLSKLALSVLVLSGALQSGFSVAGTAQTSVLVSGTVVASCTTDPSVSLDMGTIAAGEVATASTSINVSCTTASAEWTLKAAETFSPFQIGINTDYYAVIFSDAEKTKVVNTTEGLQGSGTQAKSIFVSVGRSAAPFMATLSPISDTGAFNTTLPLVLSF